MGLKDIAKRLSASVEELDEDRLHHRYAALESTDIADVLPRSHVVVAGEVKAVQVVPRAGSPWLEVVISDGTGKAVAVFSGRRSIELPGGRTATGTGRRYRHGRNGRRVPGLSRETAFLRRHLLTCGPTGRRASKPSGEIASTSACRFPACGG